MNSKRALTLLLSLLMLLSFAVVTFVSSADDTLLGASAEKAVISEPVSILGSLGKYIGYNVPSAHGQNQTRMVTVSSGTYIGVMNGTDEKDAETNITYPFSIIRVNPDGTLQVLLEEFAHNLGGTVTMMADKDENVWVYTGWGTQSGKAYFNVWRIDTKTDEIKHFQSVQKTKGAGGKMVAFIDPAYNAIYAVHSAGKFFGWCAFDITTEEWANAVYVKVDNSVCYHYAYGDGKGGFYCVHERDDASGNIYCDIEGMKVSEAQKIYRSRQIDADYMWDEGQFVYVPNAAEKEIIVQPLTECVFDVANGCYPNWYNTSSDLYWDQNSGLMYVGVCYLDNGAPGEKNHVFVIDVSNGREVVSDQQLPFLYGDDVQYNHRFYQDLQGNLWLMLTNSHDGYLEIWKGEGELKNQFKLVYNEKMPGDFDSGSALICSTNRCGSIPSDVAHVMMNYSGDWFYMEIDFAALREMAK